MNKLKKAYILCIFCLLITGCNLNAPTVETTITETDTSQSQILFDDFSYSSTDEMTTNGWIVRSGQGWPGVVGATFREENVTFMDYPEPAGNRLLRMTSSTDGTAEGSSQTQVCHQRKYLEGTYAARVRFSDAPSSGNDGDQVVQTFYMITPYDRPFNPDYSEMDFEYLPNGGWGSAATRIFVTSWETVQIEPWDADNLSTSKQGSLAGWHTLVAQVSGRTVRYFVDGDLIAQHGGEYYPDALMSINFNLWFINDGLNSPGKIREYQEDIDWVFHVVGQSLMPDEVLAKVAELRNISVSFQDTVMPGIPTSPCDL